MQIPNLEIFKPHRLVWQEKPSVSNEVPDPRRIEGAKKAKAAERKEVQEEISLKLLEGPEAKKSIQEQFPDLDFNALLSSMVRSVARLEQTPIYGNVPLRDVFPFSDPEYGANGRQLRISFNFIKREAGLFASQAGIKYMRKELMRNLKPQLESCVRNEIKGKHPEKVIDQIRVEFVETLPLTTPDKWGYNYNNKWIRSYKWGHLIIDVFFKK